MSSSERIPAMVTELLDIGLAADGTVVGVAPSGAIVHWDGEKRAWSPLGGDWPSLAQVSAGRSDDLWGITSAGEVYRGSLTGRPQPVPGTRISISAGAAGTVWAVGAGGEAFRYTSDVGTWKEEPAPVPLRQIAVGGAKKVVALDKAGRLYSYRDPEGWQAAEGSFRDISVANDGTMWAINANGHPCISGGEAGGWWELPGTLRRVSVGDASNVWGLADDSRAVDLTGGRMPFSEPHHAHPAAQWGADDIFDDRRSTHLFIVNEAARLVLEDPDPAGRQVHDLIKPGEKKIGDPFHDQLCQGLYDADYLPEYKGPEVFPWIFSWQGHFYDPDTKLNWRGNEYTAYKFFFENSYSSTGGWDEEDDHGNYRLIPPEKRGPNGYRLGLALHYLTDVTQPMHAANFAWHHSHPRLGYHSDVEAHVMEEGRQLEGVTPLLPTYIPSPNGPLGQTCGKRGTDDCKWACQSACQDLGLYIHAAAKNAKDNYSARLIDHAGDDFWGWTPYWSRVVDPLIKPMLQDAIVVTAQFLVAWMQRAKSWVTHYKYRGDWKNIRGYLTDIAAAEDGTVWGVNAQQAGHNVYRWNGTGLDKIAWRLTSIAVGSASQIWGVNAQQLMTEDNIYRWNGTGWDKIKGYLTQVAVRKDALVGDVVGVNAFQFPDEANAYYRVRPHGGWINLGAHLTRITFGTGTFWWGVSGEQYSKPMGNHENTNNIYHTQI